MKSNDEKVRITILNWDKYQREMRGGEKRRKQREWVAISSRIYSDPDFLRLTMESRYVWLMLVCYAGAVGPVFELSPSDARVLFKLRRSADFSPLVNQGFIELEAATNKTDKTDKTNITAKGKKKKKTTPKTAKRFDDFWAVYPKKRNKPDALKAWETRGLDSIADKIVAHVTRRKVSDKSWLKDGGQFIPHPATFLRGDGWEDDYGEIVAVAPVKHRKPHVPTEDELRRDREKADRELAELTRRMK